MITGQQVYEAIRDYRAPKEEWEDEDERDRRDFSVILDSRSNNGIWGRDVSETDGEILIDGVIDVNAIADAINNMEVN